MTKFTFVPAERGNHAVATLCQVVGASVSGFYAWLHAIPAVQTRAKVKAELRGHIDRIFAVWRRVYGSPRVHAELHRGSRQPGIRTPEQSSAFSVIMVDRRSSGHNPNPSTAVMDSHCRHRPDSDGTRKGETGKKAWRCRHHIFWQSNNGCDLIECYIFAAVSYGH